MTFSLAAFIIFGPLNISSSLGHLKLNMQGGSIAMSWSVFSTVFIRTVQGPNRRFVKKKYTDFWFRTLNRSHDLMGFMDDFAAKDWCEKRVSCPVALSANCQSMNRDSLRPGYSWIKSEWRLTRTSLALNRALRAVWREFIYRGEKSQAIIVNNISVW